MIARAPDRAARDRRLYSFLRDLSALALVDRAVRSVREEHDGAGGTLQICTDWRLPMDLLPSAVAAFRLWFPRIEADLRESPTQDPINALCSRKAHLGFVPTEAISRGGDFGRLFVLRSEVMVVSPATHRLAIQTAVRFGNLRHETWICPESPDHSHRPFVTLSCRLAGFAPTFGRSASTLEGLLGRVSAGYGIALMPMAITLLERPGCTPSAPIAPRSRSAPSGTNARIRRCSGILSTCCAGWSIHPPPDSVSIDPARGVIQGEILLPPQRSPA